MSESYNTILERMNKRENRKLLFSLAGFTAVFIAVVITSFYLLNQTQDLRQRAAVDCGTNLQTKIDAAASGQTVDLTGCTYTGSINITKPMTLIGGSLSSQTIDPWKPAVEVNSDNVTIQNWKFSGGGVVISILGHSKVNVINNSFSDQINSAIAIWGVTNGSNDVTIDGNTINQAKTNKVSPIIGRASEDCSVYSKNTVFKNNKVDQGEGDIGWFGVELKCHDGVIFDNNTFHGGTVLVSLPDTNNVQITNNTFDMTGSAYWGIEIAHSNNVTVSNNTFFGDGPSGTDHAVSENSNSTYSYIKNNNARDLRTLVDVGGSFISITDNCLTNVLRVTEYDSSGQNVTLSNNGPCSNTPTPYSATPTISLSTPTPLPTSLPTTFPSPTISPQDSTAPQVGITSPANGSNISVRTYLNITASASDNIGVTKVEFYVNGTLTCSDSTPSYTCTWKVPGAKNKKYSIVAKAYDAAGNNSQASVNVTAK